MLNTNKDSIRYIKMVNKSSLQRRLQKKKWEKNIVYLHSMEWRRIKTAFKRLRKSIFMFFYDFHHIMSDVFSRYSFTILFLYLFSIFIQFIPCYILFFITLYISCSLFLFTYFNTRCRHFISLPESNFTISFYFFFYAFVS